MKKTRGGLNLTKIFSCYVTIIPIIEYYKSPLQGFNLATFLAMFFLVLFGLDFVINHKRLQRDNRMTPIWMYILFISGNILLTSLLYDYTFTWDNLSIYVRFLVLFFSLLVCGHRYFDFKVAIRFLEKLLVVCAVLIFFQDFLYLGLGIGVNISIPSLLMNANDAIYAGRAGGLYMEPAHYAQSALIYICVVLFEGTKTWRLSHKSLILIILGIIASGSGQGYVLLLITYFFWLLNNMRLKKISPQKVAGIVASIVCVAGVGVIALQIPFVQSAVSRFIGDDGSLGGKALAGRTYANEFFKTLSRREKIFGVGFGHLADITNDSYVNSLYSHLIQCGYLSLGALAVIFLYLFRKGKSYAKAFAVLYAIMICFAGVATPMELCFYLLFLLFNEDKTRRHIKERV